MWLNDEWVSEWIYQMSWNILHIILKLEVPDQLIPGNQNSY